MSGLNTRVRYVVVKFAYAGESTMESRRVVNEDGSEDKDSEDEVSDLVNVLGKAGTDSGVE